MIADISLGDAWLEPYSKDGRGTSVVITRSPLADAIIQEGIQSTTLSVEPISPDTMRASQQGSYNHRHDGLYVRVKEAQARGVPMAEKRYGKKPVTFDVYFVQKLRRLTRRKSLEVWSQTQTATEFDKKMKSVLFNLKVATKITHIKRMGFKHFMQRLIARIMRKK